MDKPVATGNSEPTPEIDITFSDNDPTEPVNDPVPDQGEVDLGKFRSAQDMKEAYENLEHEFHARSEKLKELERRLDEPARHHGPPVPPGSNEELNQSFQEALQRDTIGTLTQMINGAVDHRAARDREAYDETMSEFRTLATDPRFAGVSQQVLNVINSTPGAVPVKELFYEAAYADLERRSKNQVAEELDMTRRSHVESGRSAVSGKETLRIEFDDEARRVQKAFGDDEEAFRNTTRMAAMTKASGGGGKQPVTIEEWRARRKKAGIA